MRVLIDADGCPVIDETVGLSLKNNIECVILCDTSHRIEREDARTIICSKGPDSVDFTLVNHLSAGDIVVTQDYGLAAMCLSRGAAALNRNGMEYTQENIDSLLFSRHTGQKLRRMGKRTKGPKKRTQEQNDAFCEKLQQMLERKE